MGVTQDAASSYNESVMLTVRDAAQPFQFAAQFASARVLAALSCLSSALSCESAFPSASQSLR